MGVVRCKKCGQLWEFYRPQSHRCDCGHVMVVDNATGTRGTSPVEGNIPPATRHTRVGPGGIRHPITGQTGQSSGKAAWKRTGLEESGENNA